LQNYGGTNDPSLAPSLAPTSTWFGGTVAVIYGDVQRLVQELVINTYGLTDTETAMTLGISPGNAVNLNNTDPTNNVNVMTLIKTNFPNLKIVTVPEFAINGGGNAGGTEFVQLIAETLDGQKVCEAAFTEKMRAHAIVTKTSSWEQKKSSGGWGVIFYMPVAVTSLLGA
jgi:hypothetical protein